jgi:hypothetical protein
MKPKISVLTLGLKDLRASLKFYRDGPRFTLEGDTEDIAILKMGGAWFSLYPRESLAEHVTAGRQRFPWLYRGA